MDAVTYPHQTVSHELAQHWLDLEVDVSQHQAVATSFGVTAIPMAVAVTDEGEILGRILGFVEPARFANELETLRGAR